MIKYISSLDHTLFAYINNLSFKSCWLDVIGIFLADYAVYALVAGLLLFLLRKKVRLVLAALSSALIARFGVVELIRLLHPRPRPFIQGDIHLLINRVNQLSFPSAHAAFVFGLAVVVYLHNKKMGILFLISAFLISLSRIYVGVHWPMDVLSGALVGVLSAIIINKIYGSKRISKALQKNSQNI